MSGALESAARWAGRAPFRARRAELAADPGYARQVLRDGCARARAVAAATLQEVRDAMGMRY